MRVSVNSCVVVMCVVGFSLTLSTPGAKADAQLREFEAPATMTRDRDFNRIMRRSPVAGMTTASAQANFVSVNQDGRGNTVILNLEQTNTGAVSASAALNGRLNLD